MLRVGTSGWMYDDWRGRLYPAGIPKKSWLSAYAAHFDTVEINNAFYRLPSRDAFAAWRDRVGPGFLFAVKVSRYLTHVKRLRDPAEPVARFAEHAAGLGDRLGPVLVQLPPTLGVDAGLLDAVLSRMPLRTAVEPRHESWWTTGVRAVLERHDAALVWADRHERPTGPLWRTAGWGYLRLHEGRTRPGYRRAALSGWRRRIGREFRADEDVYVYFNNDPGGAAVRDADVFRAL